MEGAHLKWHGASVCKFSAHFAKERIDPVSHLVGGGFEMGAVKKDVQRVIHQSTGCSARPGGGFAQWGQTQVRVWSSGLAGP